MTYYFNEDKNIRLNKTKNIANLLQKANFIYFLGIGGIGISGLVRLFLGLGKKVAGVDLYKNETTEQFEENGVKVFYQHKKENIDEILQKHKKIDVVIFSPAINDDNIELKYLKEKQIPCISYGEALSFFVNSFNSISVCGTHGKSSTTAILSEVLIDKGLNLAFLCGAILKKFNSNAIYNKNPDYFIAESCEYKETFLNFFPNNAIIPSLEVDHLDYYKTEENYLSSFKAFVNQIKNGVLVMRIETDLEIRLYEYSKQLKNIDKIFVYFCSKINEDEKRYNFNEGQIYFKYLYDEKTPFSLTIEEKKIINKKQISIDKISLTIPIPSGEYAANFTGVIAFLISQNLFSEEIKKIIKNYSGIKRRFDIIGFDKNNNIVISDYAHHPSEIETLIKIAKLKFPDKKRLLIFQAHQHSRTRLLLNEFLNLFKNVEQLIILPIYRQRDSEQDYKLMSSQIFYNEVKKVNPNSIYFEDLNELYSFLSKKNGLVFLFTGAGTIDNFAREYLTKTK